MSFLETYRGVVYPAQLDHMQHMNVQWYTQVFDQATWQLMGYIGINMDYMVRNRRCMVALEQRTRYLAEVHAGDLLVVRSRFIELVEKRVSFEHTLLEVQRNITAATTELVGMHIDRDSRKGCPFSDEIVERYRACLASQSAP